MAFIVEVEYREPNVIYNISKNFFKGRNFRIITLPAGENIYMLWKRLKADDFNTDIIEVLRENSRISKDSLDGLSRDDFSEVYLFFDYDVHQDNLKKDNDSDVVMQMLENFDNETENGKLYISYPMVEAVWDYKINECGNTETCFVDFGDIKNYKKNSASRSFNSNIRDYNFNTWRNIIDVFSMKAACLMNTLDVMSYETYSEVVSPYTIYELEKKEAASDRVFVLSAFPEFLIDYFGIKLWKKCVENKNRLNELHCR